MLLTPAEQLLQELGVTEPKEIDLEAIAFHVGARVRRRTLDGCEAQIIGFGDTAVITVNSASSYRRSRFSIAHELGHWRHHRNKCLVCRAHEMRPLDGLSPSSALSPERIADGYAADMLLPHYLFRPIVRQYGKISLKAVGNIADLFETSLTATASRLVQVDAAAAILVCHGPQGRKWFTRAPSVPSRWFPQDALDVDSFAFSVLFGNKADDPMPRKVGAEAWFDRNEAGRYELQEQSCRTGADEILTLLLFTDKRMLEQ